MSIGFGGIGLGAVGSALGMYLDWQGAKDARELSQNQFEKEKQAQEEFARNGVRWRVEDALAAGIHPLAALGANVTSYSPQSLFTGPNELSVLGQDIREAAARTMTAAEKSMAVDADMAYKKRKQELDIRHAELLNLDLEKKVFGTPGTPTVNPDPVQQYFGVPGQADVSNVGVDYGSSGDAGIGHMFKTVDLPKSGRMGVSSGVGPWESEYIDRHGFMFRGTEQNASQSAEDDIVLNTQRAIRKGSYYKEGLLAWTGDKEAKEWLERDKPKEVPSPDYEWYYHPFDGLWQLMKKKRVNRLFIFEKPRGFTLDEKSSWFERMMREHYEKMDEFGYDRLGY